MSRQDALKRFYNQQLERDQILKRERSAAGGRTHKGKNRTEGRDEIAAYLEREPTPRSYL